ncbi:MAG: hypothetical protein CVU50_09590 [Candidatus Cloacimonetes bacterium HGW-Cloacimonetes-3]|nr:MAG: hypothetical protein CVU50_09590 [Candidatus Cloacimonetes bacterium HGW-Cloacimonetes-3]
MLLLSFNLHCIYTLRHKTNNLAIYSEAAVSGNLKNGLEGLDPRIDALQMSLGIYIDKPASIYLVKDHESYQRLSLGKAKIVEFSDAFYSGNEGRIYIRPVEEIKESFTNTLLHEYIHWYLENIFAHTPLWFHEGMAVQYSGQMGFERYVYFLQQSFFGRSSDLFRMSYSYPKKQEDWQIFYLSSSMAVRFMRENKDNEWAFFWELVSRQQKAGKKAVFSEGFSQAYRTNLYDFHLLFAAYVKRLRFQYLFWGINSLLAIFLPLVLILAHHQKRKRMALLPDLPEPVDETEDTEETEV